MSKIFRIFNKKAIVSVVSSLIVSCGLAVASSQSVYAANDAEVKAENAIANEAPSNNKTSEVENVEDDETQKNIGKLNKIVQNVTVPLSEMKLTMLEQDGDLKKCSELVSESSGLSEQVKCFEKNIDDLKQKKPEERNEEQLDIAKDQVRLINEKTSTLKDKLNNSGLNLAITQPSPLEELPQDNKSITNETLDGLRNKTDNLINFSKNIVSKIKNLNFDEIRNGFKNLLNLWKEGNIASDNSEFAISKIDSPVENKSCVTMTYSANENDEFTKKLNLDDEFQLRVTDLSKNEVVFLNDVFVIDLSQAFFKDLESLGNMFIPKDSSIAKEEQKRKAKKFNKTFFTIGTTNKDRLNEGSYKIELINKKDNSVVMSADTQFNLKTLNEQKKEELANMFVGMLKAEFSFIEQLLDSNVSLDSLFSTKAPVTNLLPAAEASTNNQN